MRAARWAGGAALALFLATTPAEAATPTPGQTFSDLAGRLVAPIATPSSPSARGVLVPAPPAAPPPHAATPVPGVLHPAGQPPAPLARPAPAGQPSLADLAAAVIAPRDRLFVSLIPADRDDRRVNYAVPEIALSAGSLAWSLDDRRLLLDVPIRSQFDGTIYQRSNCGPSSLAMVLDGFGVHVSTLRVRQIANRLQGTQQPDDGIALDYLAYIASTAGLRPTGLREAAGYRRWTVQEVRDEVRRGHPVITLVKMRELPDQTGSRSEVDHYVVVVGLEGETLLINDPADFTEGGYRRPIMPAQLERAWAASSIPRHAVAIGAADGMPEPDLPDPAPLFAAPDPLPPAAPSGSVPFGSDDPRTLALLPEWDRPDSPISTIYFAGSDPISPELFGVPVLEDGQGVVEGVAGDADFAGEGVVEQEGDH